jgi:hypothetical protein
MSHSNQWVRHAALAGLFSISRDFFKKPDGRKAKIRIDRSAPCLSAAGQ